MRIVVTGASGNVGTPLVRRLLADGHDVVGLCRRIPPATPPYSGASWHRVDLSYAPADWRACRTRGTTAGPARAQPSRHPDHRPHPARLHRSRRGRLGSAPLLHSGAHSRAVAPGAAGAPALPRAASARPHQLAAAPPAGQHRLGRSGVRRPAHAHHPRPRGARLAPHGRGGRGAARGDRRDRRGPGRTVTTAAQADTA
ncbi:NAD(P)-dependent oxidoreductase [Dietzia sp. Marseille-Q0999]|nr:NAD(P)-dependent oxidoreductase [Dietzia massiliensis]